MQCLLIEDDLDDQEIFLLCVEQVTSEVECVVLNCGVLAIKKLEEDKSFIPDVIFLDVNMPKMNGLDCLKQLRSMPRLNNTRIYIYSTTSELSIVEKAKELGADDYIVKLAKTSDLKQKLKNIFIALKAKR